MLYVELFSSPLKWWTGLIAAWHVFFLSTTRKENPRTVCAKYVLKTRFLWFQVTVTQRRPESRSEENLNLRPTKLKPAATAKGLKTTPFQKKRLLKLITSFRLWFHVRAESSRRTKSADGVGGESLEQYKNDNQTLLLQVGLQLMHAWNRTLLCKCVWEMMTTKWSISFSWVTVLTQFW